MEQSRFAYAAGITLPATAFFLPPLAVFAPLGAAPLLALVALILLALDWRRCRDALHAEATLALLLASMGIWATASALWSILPSHSFLEGLRFLAVSAGGLMVLGAARATNTDQRRRIGTALTIGVALAIVLLMIERFGNLPLVRLALGIPRDQYIALARFDRGVTVLILSLWATYFAVAARWQRFAIAFAILATAAVMASQTAFLAGLISVGVYAVARLAPRAIAAAMILGLVTVSCAIPLAAPSNESVVALWHNAPWIKASGIHRLLIWRFGADRAAERPFLGWGMDASREIPGGKTDLNAMLPDLHYGDRIESMPLHPHDAALQWQLELGLPGLILGLSVVAWIIWWIGWRAPLEPNRRAGALAVTAAALTVGLLSFGVWQAWWLSTLWLVSALYIASAREAGRSA